MMPHQVRATGFQSAAAEVLHMPTSSRAASGTFLKNKYKKKSHAVKVKTNKLGLMHVMSLSK